MRAAGDFAGEGAFRGRLRPFDSGVTGDSLRNLLLFWPGVIGDALRVLLAPFWLPLGDVPLAAAGEPVRGERDAFCFGVGILLATCGDSASFSCLRGERDASLDEAWGDAAREPVGDAGLEDVGETGAELSASRNGDLTS